MVETHVINVDRLGRFDSEPSRADLERFFFLDDEDRKLIAKRRGDHNRLGFALQLTTVRYIGTFLVDPLEVPWPVVDYLAEQLEITDVSVVKRYTEREKTVYEHAWEIQAEQGWRDFFKDEEIQRSFQEFLEGRAWTHTESRYKLFAQAVAWLRRHQVLLFSGPKLMRRVVAAIEEAKERTNRIVAEAAASADVEMPVRLHSLLAVPVGARFSELERLRRPPRRTSGKAMVDALDRANDVFTLGAGKAQLQQVPTNRLKNLADVGLKSKAAHIAQMAEPHRTATLVAAARYLEVAAVDDALDLFHMLMATRLIAKARREAATQRLESMPRLERASKSLAEATKAFVAVLQAAKGSVDVEEAWAAIEAVAPREELMLAADMVSDLVPDANVGEVQLRRLLTEKYGVVRPFLELLSEVLPLGATAAGGALLDEVRRLPDLAKRRPSVKPLRADEVDADLVNPAWERAVFANPELPEGAADRDAYVLCVLEHFHRALRRRDIFATCSVRWSDPRSKLLSGPEWIARRDDVTASLQLGGSVHAHLAELVGTLAASWRQLADRLDAVGPDAGLRLVPDAEGRMRLDIDQLDKEEEPASLKELRRLLESMMPRVDLPELLLEVHAWTGFLDEFTHIAGRTARLEDIAVSLAAVLVAESCNIGLTPVVNPGVEALTYDRLSHISQNYLRAETFAAAAGRLIDHQRGIGTAAAWGGGLVASVDGMRFTVPIATLNAAPNPKYFALKKGLTWLNAINDQFAGIGAVTVPGTVRDSLYILDTILGIDGGPKIEQVITDTASYSDIVFGVFRILGYRFTPQVAGIGDQRLWRATLPGEPDDDYGALNAIARHRVNLGLITAHWEDMVRVAATLVDGQVRAYDLLRVLSRDGNPTPLGKAFAEYGRIAKTIHMLALVDPVDTGYRRTIRRQRNMSESRHALARRIYHGQRGLMYKAYREGQEDQLDALGLVLNAVVLWNTRYIDAALGQLRRDGHDVDAADVARLTPLGSRHLNFLGRYSFAAPQLVGLRPFHTGPDLE
jgi:TnpA family transposase